MRSFGLKNKLKKLGFTLAETLIVVGILAILAGIGVPSALAIKKNLKMTELDEHARSLFVAAQNHASQLRIANKLIEVDALTASMAGQPSDFPESELDWSAGDYRYIVGGSEAAGLLFTLGAIDDTLISGEYIIEYNALTGMIYGVFFAEEGFDYINDVAPNGQLRLDRADRKANEPMIGYYGGADIDYKELEILEPPKLLLINEEELYLQTWLPKTNDDNTATDIKYYIEIKDEFGNVCTYGPFNVTDLIFPANFSADDEGEYKRLTVTLDSLSLNKHFAELFSEQGINAEASLEGTALVPGADITVSVIATLDGKIPGIATAQDNSLFAEKKQTTADENEALILNYRHLQNLESTVSKLDDAVKITSALQGESINWEDASGQQLNFVSINNSLLKLYDGAGNRIANLNAALFDGYGSDAVISTIKNVRLMDIQISGNLQNMGTLANTAIKTEIENCVIFASDKNDYSTATLESGTATLNTGGFIGAAQDCTINKSSASLALVNARGGNVGGFIGKAQASTISECFADNGYWDYEGGEWKKQNAQSDVNAYGIISQNGTVGGFLGEAENVNVNNSYAVGNIAEQNGIVAGFAAQTNSGGYSNCYAAMTFDGTQDEAVQHGFANIRVGASCIFVNGESVPAGNEQQLSFAELAEFEAQTEWGDKWSKATLATTTAYGRQKATEDEEKTYPFPRLKNLMHYGDWANEEGEVPLVYYEKYADNSYGYYGTVDETEIDTLNNTKVVVADGYAVLAEKDSSEPTVIIDDEEQTIEKIAVYVHNTELSFDVYRIVLTAEEQYKYTAAAANFYTNIKINGEGGWFNPCFAKTVQSTAAKPAKPQQIIVRTARQLNRLGGLNGSGAANNKGYWASGNNYLQERDIDFAKYTLETVTIIRIGESAEKPFAGNYNGGRNIITGSGVDQTVAVNMGLFGYNTGTLENIAFVSDFDSGTVREVAGKSNIGALCGYNTGTINNCAAAGFDVYATDNNAGGLVGYNTGTITNSAADNSTLNAGNPGGSMRVGGSVLGGFVGYNSGTISSCYSLATVEDGGSTIGGFVGNNAAGTISNCYSVAYDKSFKGNVIATFAGGGAGTLVNTVAYDEENSDAIKAFDGKNGFEMVTAEKTYPYDTALRSQAYIFPSSVKHSSPAHYGNWPTVKVTNGFFYYEIYQKKGGGEDTQIIGFHSIDKNGEVFDTLRYDYDDIYYVVGDGYVVISDKDISSGNDRLYWIGDKYQNYNPGMLDSAKFKKYLPQGYMGVPIDLFHSGINPNRAFAFHDGINFYTSVKLFDDDNQIYYFNPYMAKTATAVKPNSNPQTVEVRTPRHLKWLSIRTTTPVWNLGASIYYNFNYLQSYDIDFNTYKYEEHNGDNAASFMAMTSIFGSDNGNFTSVFDGDGYKILVNNIASVGQGYGGLFGFLNSAQSAVKNVNLIGLGQNNSTVSGSRSTGAIMGNLRNGVVENCTVSNLSVTSTGGAVGGLVGEIENVAGNNILTCHTENVKVIGIKDSGGLIGDSQAAEISNCTVKDSIVYSSGNNAGGFVGNMRGNPVLDKNIVYNIDVSGTDNIGGYIGFNGANVKNGIAYNCTISGASGVGGFIGYCNASVAVENCAVYDSNITATGQYVGGFIGFTTGAKINRCSTVLGFSENSMFNVNNSSSTAGFVGHLNGGSIENSYAIVKFNSDASDVYGFARNVPGIPFANNYCLAQNASDDYILFSSDNRGVAYDGTNIADIQALVNTAPTIWGYDESGYSLPTSVRDLMDESKFKHYGTLPIID